MIDAPKLKDQTSKILHKKVLAVGIFDASLNIGNRTFAPLAAGVATYIGTKALEKKLGNEGAGAKATATAAVAGVAGALGTKYVAGAHSARKKGLTPVMVCAITANRIYLLGWNGNHRDGTGPSRVLAEFSRADAKIKTRKRGVVHHVVDIKEDGSRARIECNLGVAHSNKKMNKEVLELLKESSQ